MAWDSELIFSLSTCATRGTPVLSHQGQPKIGFVNPGQMFCSGELSFALASLQRQLLLVLRAATYSVGVHGTVGHRVLARLLLMQVSELNVFNFPQQKFASW